MTYFEVTGWEMPTLVEASARVSSLLKELSDPVAGYAVEAHCRELADLKLIAGEVPSSGCACYCWKPIADGSELRLESFSALRRARLVFGVTKIYIDADQDLPPYDWVGSPSAYSIVRLDTFNPEPLKSEDKVPSPTTIRLLSTITNEIAGEILEPVGVSTSWKTLGREHTYFLKVPKEKATLIAAEICAVFSLTDGMGSFEFAGSPERLETIRRNSEFRFEHFPENCWNLNHMAATPFSFGISAMRFPVPNVSSEQLLPVASLIDRLDERVQFRCVAKHYIAWKLSESTFSPRVQGNSILITRQKTGYTMFLGFERYEDKDPIPKRFSSYASPVLERMGAKLKRVQYPR